MEQKINRINPAEIVVGQTVYVTDARGIVRQAEVTGLPVQQPNRFVPGGKCSRMEARLEDGRVGFISCLDTFADRAEAEKLAEIMRGLR